VLHPSQFQINEAWIAFQLNEKPIHTEQDGSFNCFCLMDASSCYIFGVELVPASEAEPSQLQIVRLLQAAWGKKRQFPKTLYLPKGRFQNAVVAEAARRDIAVISVEEDKLLPFIGDAREGYREHLLQDDR